MCSILKQKGKITSTLATVITDFGEDPYNEWTSNHEFIDYIFVAHREIKNNLIEKGIDANKIFDTGIPISDKFLKSYSKTQILEDLGLQEQKKTILFFGGGEMGLGKSKTLHIFEYLVKNFSPIQIIAISGKNESLKNSFEKIVAENHKNQTVKILGFTDRVAEFMAISDLVVTKPGGLTSTEALVSNLPILAINPIPRSRRRKCKFFRTKWCCCLAKEI